MVDFEKDLDRAEFLKKNSPIVGKDTPKVSPPPLFSQEEKSSILGEIDEIKKEKKLQFDFSGLLFWKNWKEKQYTYVSLGLAVLLIGYVGISVSGLSQNDESLNATLTVPEQNQENSITSSETIEKEIIESEVVDSSLVIEDIQKDSSDEESNDITEYIYESYDL